MYERGSVEKDYRVSTFSNNGRFGRHALNHKSFDNFEEADAFAKQVSNHFIKSKSIYAEGAYHLAPVERINAAKGLVPSLTGGYPRISKDQAAELLKSKQFKSITYQKKNGEIANYNSAQHRVRPDELVGAPPPEGYKSYTEFDEKTQSLVLRNIKEGENEVKRRRFSLSGIKQIRANNETYDVFNRGFVPNFAIPLGSGAFGQFFDLERQFKGLPLGKKIFGTRQKDYRDSVITKELESQRILEYAQELKLLPQGLKIPQSFGSLGRSLSRGSYGKEVIPGVTGQQFAERVDNNFRHLKGSHADTGYHFANNISDFIESGFSDLGLRVADIHSSNYIINKPLSETMFNLIGTNPDKAQAISEKSGAFDSYLKNILKNKGGSINVIDAGGGVELFSKQGYSTDPNIIREHLKDQSLRKRLTGRNLAGGFLPNISSLNKRELIELKNKLRYDTRNKPRAQRELYDKQLRKIDYHLDRIGGKDAIGAAGGYIPNFANGDLPPLNFINSLIGGYRNLSKNQRAARDKYAISTAQELGVYTPGQSGFAALKAIRDAAQNAAQTKREQAGVVFGGIPSPLPTGQLNFPFSPPLKLEQETISSPKPRQLNEKEQLD